MNKILLGDCLEVLRTLPSDSVHATVVDPPYGLGTREPTGQEIIQYLQGADLDTGGDFMGRDWDIPSVAVWKECFRVLKPGGHLLSFGGTRTFDLISVGIRAAGFECRDTIAQQFGVQVFEWIQGSGFPKGQNIRKALEKMGLSAEEANLWEGWNCQLKPSWEPILVFRKPIAEKTIAKQVLATGTGALNIDACRVGGAPRTTHAGVNITGAREQLVYSGGELKAGLESVPPSGRWPANLLLTHSDSCQITGTKRVPAPVINRFADGMKPFGDGAGHEYTSEQTGDADGMEEVPVYACEDGCPVKVLDEQSGDKPPSFRKARTGRSDSDGHCYGDGMAGSSRNDGLPFGHQDSGGASRYFPQFEPEAPFLYSPKVSKAERDRGLAKGTNKHPTVKPLAVMRWLVRLVTPKGGTVLDPYCGSGTTCLAAMEEGCAFIGIERDPESHAVAILRTTREPDVFDELEQVR